MTDQSMSSSVEVATDPATAFAAFTEEIGTWWLQGPINYFDSTKAFGKRIEPGVGGRLVEVYDEATGEGLELGRITVWEPGARVAWDSSVDDVRIDVRFDPTDGGGTLVRVEATIPDGGADRGGTAWLRMTPVWFGAWCAKRGSVPHEPERLSRLGIAVHYSQPFAAARWLRDVFAFEPAGDIPDDDPAPDDYTWIEFRVGAALVIVTPRHGDDVREGAAVTHTPWVFVDDVDAHYETAKAGGATIVEEMWQHGARAYGAADLEGNRWTFAQALPLMRR